MRSSNRDQRTCIQLVTKLRRGKAQVPDVLSLFTSELSLPAQPLQSSSSPRKQWAALCTSHFPTADNHRLSYQVSKCPLSGNNTLPAFVSL